MLRIATSQSSIEDEQEENDDRDDEEAVDEQARFAPTVGAMTAGNTVVAAVIPSDSDMSAGKTFFIGLG